VIGRIVSDCRKLWGRAYSFSRVTSTFASNSESYVMIMSQSFSRYLSTPNFPVDPKCDILSDTARTLAVGSVELLENAKIFATLEDCVKDLQRVYATTARNRYVSPSSVITLLACTFIHKIPPLIAHQGHEPNYAHAVNCIS
jgi:hypothetical protein